MSLIPNPPSPNIAEFDFLVQVNLSNNTITENDNSIYIGGGAALVQGINFVITSPLGTTIWSNANFATPDITPSAPLPFTKTCPTFNGQLEWGQYTVTGTIKDQNGTLYTLTKQLIVCKPQQNSTTLGNYGVTNIAVRVDCKNAKLICGDYTAYVYNTVIASSVDRLPANGLGWIIYQPALLNLAPVTASFQVLNVSPLYNGIYAVKFLSNATYDFGNGWTVIVPYTYYQKEINVSCDINLCDAYCALEKLVNRYETACNMNPSEAKELKDFIDAANTEMNLIAAGQTCGKDVSGHVEKLNEILDVNCICSCGSQVPVQPTAICCEQQIDTVAGCGDISVSATTVGTQTVWTVSDISYVIQSSTEDNGLTISAVQSGCTKTYFISICVDNLLLCSDYTICTLVGSLDVNPSLDYPTSYNYTVHAGQPLKDILNPILATECVQDLYIQQLWTWVTNLNAGSITAPGWHALTLLNSWGNLGSNSQSAQYRLWTTGAQTGLVEIRGIISKNSFTGVQSVVFNCPAGTTPAKNQQMAASLRTNAGTDYCGTLFVSIGGTFLVESEPGFEASTTIVSIETSYYIT